MFHICKGRFYETPSSVAADGLQFLGDLLELITLDYVTHLIFAKIAQLDSAFEAGTDFLYVVLETAQRRNPAVINRLALSQDASARSARDAAIGHEATSDNASAQLENLFHLRVSDYGFTQLRFEQTGHGIFDLIEQLIDKAVKLSLHSFPFRGRDCHAFNLNVKTDHHRVRRAGQKNVGFRNRSNGRVNNLQIDFSAFDLLQCIHDRFDRALGVGFQNDPQPFSASSCFEQCLEGGALWNEKLVRSLCLKPFVTQLLGGALRFHYQEFVARIRQTSEPENFHRRRRPGLFYGFATVVEQGFYFAAVISAYKWVTDF